MPSWFTTVTSSVTAPRGLWRRGSINWTQGGSVSGLPSLLRLLGMGEELSVTNVALRGILGSKEYWDHLRTHPQLKEPAITFAITGTNVLVPGSFVRLNPGREGLAVGVVPGIVRPSVSVTRPDTYSIFLGVPGAKVLPVLPGLLHFSFIELARLGPKYPDAGYELGGSITIGFTISLFSIPGVQCSANVTVALGLFHPALTPYVEWIAPYVRWLNHHTQRVKGWLGRLWPRWRDFTDHMVKRGIWGHHALVTNEPGASLSACRGPAPWPCWPPRAADGSDAAKTRDLRRRHGDGTNTVAKKGEGWDWLFRLQTPAGRAGHRDHGQAWLCRRTRPRCARQ